ncbi:MAG: 4-hydroxy-tetrahydrodipicolinate synthase [Planctomycetota bacterium]|nr:MAG: 4-hydroxy-tetrahydrodipicolinate synthase [Planctomycetota bacterium]
MLVTALVTPFREGGALVNGSLLQELIAFQLAEGAHQVLLAGTTGEGAALSEEERGQLLDAALEVAEPRQLMVALGFGRLPDVIERGQDALARGVRDLLLVDCPYSGASSAGLREHWHGAVAAALPEARLLPYAIPQRTGTELLPDDLARLVEDHPNVIGVKDATGRLARMLRVRELCGPDFHLLCGEDSQLRDAMLDPNIRADGAVSVASHLAPRSVRDLVEACRRGDATHARELHDALLPLFQLVTFHSSEALRVGEQQLQVPQRLKNPVPLKACLEHLGVAVGTCRAPLSAVNAKVRAQLEAILDDVFVAHRNVLAPLHESFGAAGDRRVATSGGAAMFSQAS